MNRYVPYYRVSTEGQGESGLGLQGQKDYLLNFINPEDILEKEFIDIETGKSSDRDNLNKAIDYCRDNNCTLLAYDISRISRAGLAMRYKLQKYGIEFVAALTPNESDLSRNIRFEIAREEVENISRNTKKALAVIQDKLDRGEIHVSKSGRVITKLGSPKPISREAIEKSAEVRKNRAKSNPNNVRAGALIVALKKGGSSFYSIAETLNASGFKTSRGNDFSQVQVKRLYNRYKTDDKEKKSNTFSI